MRVSVLSPCRKRWDRGTQQQGRRVIGLSFEAVEGSEMATNSDGAPASSKCVGPDEKKPIQIRARFLYILVLYIAGRFMIPDPRTSWELWDGYRLSGSRFSWSPPP